MPRKQQFKEKRDKTLSMRLTTENLEKLQKYCQLYEISMTTAVNWWIESLEIGENNKQ